MNKNLIKNIVFVFSSVLLVSLVFGTGFYFGGSKTGNNNASASGQADLESFWKVWGLLEDKFVGASSTQSISEEDRIYGAIEGLVDAYGDPYTTFLPPVENKEFNESIQGNFEGVGMEVSIQDDVLTVVAPLKDTPAERAGIRSGDKIVKIEDKSTYDMTLDKAVSLIRGEPGTTVTVTVLREGEDEPLEISIIRDVINIPNLETELRDDGVFVISLFNFSARSTEAFREALREFLLSRTNKLVLDLRGNPGGYLDAAVDISSWFLPAGKVVVVEDFGNKKDNRIFRSKGYNIFNDNLKMVILIDQGSASASEIVAGALQDHGIAKIVGVSSFGKGSVQELIEITDDTSLKVTIAQWLTPEGTSISDGGLVPDYEIEVTKEDIESNKDPQIQKAVELLLE